MALRRRAASRQKNGRTLRPCSGRSERKGRKKELGFVGAGFKPARLTCLSRRLIDETEIENLTHRGLLGGVAETFWVNSMAPFIQASSAEPLTGSRFRYSSII